MSLFTFQHASPPCLYEGIIGYCIICGGPALSMRYTDYDVHSFFAHFATSSEMDHLPHPTGYGGTAALDWFFNTSDKHIETFCRNEIPRKYKWNDNIISAGRWMSEIHIVQEDGTVHAASVKEDDVNTTTDGCWKFVGDSMMAISTNQEIIGEKRGVIMHVACHALAQQVAVHDQELWQFSTTLQKRNNINYGEMNGILFPKGYMSIYGILHKSWLFVQPTLVSFNWRRFEISTDRLQPATPRKRTWSNANVDAGAFRYVAYAGYLSLSELYRCVQISKAWYQVCEEPGIWKNKMEQRASLASLFVSRPRTCRLDWKRIVQHCVTKPSSRLKNNMRISDILHQIKSKQDFDA